MYKRRLVKLAIAFTALSVFASFFLSEANAQKNSSKDPHTRLIKQVRQELATLPYYGVFDWLEYEVRPDNTVVLRGEVIRPTTKTEAEGRVKDIDGVKQVINEIEVLPLSPSDDRLRLALYRSLYDWNSPLFRYATQSVPPIHIIVKNGRAVLKGTVGTKNDSDVAYIRVRSVPGLFDVKNELAVEEARA